MEVQMGITNLVTLAQDKSAVNTLRYQLLTERLLIISLTADMIVIFIIMFMLPSLLTIIYIILFIVLYFVVIVIATFIILMQFTG